MKKLKNDTFFINWVLRDEIAIGPAPTQENHIYQLKEKKIQGILSLCSIQEAMPPNDISKNFRCERIILPDHTYDKNISLKEIKIVLNRLEELKKVGPTFVHCKAAVERSPLICIAWLIRHESLTIKQSLDYLMKVNRGTCPSANQLKLLEDFI